MRVPTFGATSVGSLRDDEGATVSRTMPAAIGGDGAPTTPMIETEYRWTATDEDGDEVNDSANHGVMLQGSRNF